MLNQVQGGRFSSKSCATARTLHELVGHRAPRDYVHVSLTYGSHERLMDMNGHGAQRGLRTAICATQNHPSRWGPTTMQRLFAVRSQGPKSFGTRQDFDKGVQPEQNVLRAYTVYEDRRIDHAICAVYFIILP